MASSNNQLYANKEVAIIIHRLGKKRKKGWQNEDVSHNVSENKGDEKLIWLKFVARPECI